MRRSQVARLDVLDAASATSVMAMNVPRVVGWVVVGWVVVEAGQRGAPAISAGTILCWLSIHSVPDGLDSTHQAPAFRPMLRGRVWLKYFLLKCLGWFVWWRGLDLRGSL